MLIKVFNKETTLIETIESNDLDKTKHFNRNTHDKFTDNDIKNFWKKELLKK